MKYVWRKGNPVLADADIRGHKKNRGEYSLRCGMRLFIVINMFHTIFLQAKSRLSERSRFCHAFRSWQIFLHL